MRSMPSRARFAAALALVALVAPAAWGGPISEMLARHRTNRQMRLPPMEKPFSTRPVKDISPSNLSGRFKKRFSLTRPDGTSLASRLFAPKGDPGVEKTSR